MLYNPYDEEVVVTKHEKIAEFHPVSSYLMTFTTSTSQELTEQQSVNKNRTDDEDNDVM